MVFGRKVCVAARGGLVVRENGHWAYAAYQKQKAIRKIVWVTDGDA